MLLHRTTDYFHITAKEAGITWNGDETVEEAKVLDCGLEHHFFQTLESLEKEFHSERRKAYAKNHGYDVILFELVADNSNHNRYCMVFQ